MRVTRPTDDISPKVTAATLATALAGFVLWCLDAYVMTPGVEGDVPMPVVIFVTTGVAFLAGYMRHDTPPGRHSGNRK